MKATEIRDSIFAIEKELYRLSDNIASDIEWDSIDPVYLRSKFVGIENVVNHIKKFQLKGLGK